MRPWILHETSGCGSLIAVTAITAWLRVLQARRTTCPAGAVIWQRDAQFAGARGLCRAARRDRDPFPGQVARQCGPGEGGGDTPRAQIIRRPPPDQLAGA